MPSVQSKNTIFEHPVLNYFTGFFKSILIYAEIFVKAMVVSAIKKKRKIAREESKVINLLGNFFESLPVLFISNNP